MPEIAGNNYNEYRKLAAIMFTDMVGYSALSQSDENLALKLLDEHKQILNPIFSKHFGKIVAAIGDGFFIEFESALEAVLCAVEIQEKLFKRNIGLTDEKKITIRIGIHLGDVIYKNNNLFGDGVNIAARLEPIAEPGGICISEDVYRQVRNKINFNIRKLLKKRLKNISASINVFKIELPWLQSKTTKEPEVVSHYRIIEKIGEGGMGEIFKAEDLNLNRLVSIKFLPKRLSTSTEAKKQFIEEARTVSMLEHPNICNIYEVDETEDEQLFIVMPLYSGETLKDKIKKNNLSLNQKIDYAIQITQGVAKAHQKGITHGDIKPTNIIVTDDGVVKIIDFGVARLKTSGVTQLKASKGTLEYISPEQINGKDANSKSDIWSLGIIMYELLSNALPFTGKDEQELINSILNDRPKKIKGNTKISTKLENIVKHCLEKDPEKRISSASKLLEELEDFKFSISNKARAAGIKGLSTELKLVFSSLLLILLFFIGYFAINFFNKEPERKHIAVVPFENVGNDPANQAFCDGLVETLNSQLTQIGDLQKSLWVVPASEVRKNDITSPSDALKDFGVSLAVTGSVQRSLDKIRLAVNIVDTKTSRQLRSMVHDYTLSDVTSLQDEAVKQISKMLEIELHPKTIKDISEGSTQNSDAYLYYVQGRGYLHRYWEKENINSAISLFNRAVKEDSTYALAYSALGEAYWRKYELEKNNSLVKTAEYFCNKALTLNNNLASVHLTFGIIKKGTGRYKEAVNEFLKALEIDPINSDALRELADAYSELNNFAKAEETYKKAIEVKPDYWSGYNYLGTFYFSQKRYKDAEEQFNKVVELTPDNYRGYFNLGAAYYLMSKFQDAKKYFERSLEIKPNSVAYSNLATIYFSNDKNYYKAAELYSKALEENKNDYRLWANLALSYRRLIGRKLESVRAYQKAAQLAEQQREINPNDKNLLERLAEIYSLLGDSAKAAPLIEKSLKLAAGDINILASSVEIYELSGARDKAITNLDSALSKGYNVLKFKQNPELKDLIKDERFKQLEEKYKQ